MTISYASAQLAHLLTPQEQLAQNHFELTLLPFCDTAAFNVIPYPQYCTPEGFVGLEIQRDTLQVTAHLVQAANPAQRLEIPLPLTDEIRSEIQSGSYDVNAIPFQVGVDVLSGSLFLMAFNTLWSLLFRSDKSAYAEIGDDSYDQQKVHACQSQLANLNILRDEAGKLVSQKQELVTENSKYSVRATAENEVTITDKTSGQVRRRFTLMSNEGRSQHLYKIQFVGESDHLALRIGDTFKLIRLNPYREMITMSCTDFAVNEQGLGAIWDGQRIQVVNLLHQQLVVELSTASASPHLYLTDDEPHVIHGNQCFKIKLPPTKRFSHQGYNISAKGYQFTSKSTQPTHYMSISDVLRHFAKHKHPRLVQIHGCSMIHSKKEVLQLAMDQKRVVRTEFYPNDTLLPLLETQLDAVKGFYAPTESGQIFHSKMNSTIKRPLLPEAVLAHLRISELHDLKSRVQTHQDEVGFRMYMRWLHGDEEVNYKHHLVTKVPHLEILVSATHWNALRFWDAMNGKLVHQFELPLGETLLDEAVAQCVFLPDSETMLVIMHSGRIYRVDHYLSAEAKFEMVYQVSGFSRIDVSWVQHQRYALICEGCWNDKGVYANFDTHSKPLILDLLTLTPQALPAMHEQSFEERPLAVCPEGRYLLIDATTCNGDDILPFHQRVVDLYHEGGTTSWAKSYDFINEVSNIATNGVFHVLRADMKLKTLQWAPQS